MEQEKIELDVCAKTASFGQKCWIRRGYYPAKLTAITEYKDADGKPKESKFGRQIILGFEIYQPGPNGEPTKIMTYESDVEGRKVTKDVTLSKFVYHMYKNKKTGELSTAVTPSSAVTRVFEALGWNFDATKPLRVNDFVGKWAELNIDDYDAKRADETTYKASTVKEVKKYEGPTPTLQPVTPVKKESTLTPEERQKLEENKKALKDQLDKGLLTSKGYELAMEQINVMLNR